MIPAERAHLKAHAITHPGMSGKNNEDRYAVAAFRTEGERPVPVLFAIISDGIGGHRAGEIAAEMVVETVSQAVAQSNAGQPVQTLREAIMRSSQQILVQAESDPEKKGMGATCACALIIDDRLYIAYVGDSRTYLLRNGEIHQLSIDHTWIQEAIDVGILEPDQGKDHPNAHVIRRYLGSKQPVEPDTRLRLTPAEDNNRAEANQGLHLRPNDRILLCSDGLTDLVNDIEINSALSEDDQEKALQILVDLANHRGGHDNITIVSLRVPDSMPEATQPISVSELPPPKKKRSGLLIAVVALLFLLLLLAAGGAYIILGDSNGPQPTSVSSPQPGTTQPVVQPSLQPTPSILLSPTPADASAVPATNTPKIETSPVGTLSPMVSVTFWPTNTLAP